MNLCRVTIEEKLGLRDDVEYFDLKSLFGELVLEEDAVQQIHAQSLDEYTQLKFSSVKCSLDL